MPPVGQVVVHRGVLGEDRDALFALEVLGVHHPVLDFAAFAQRAGLPQHGVDERRLAVVDVRDDGDVAEVIPRSLRSCPPELWHPVILAV